jgi:glutamyl-tRNA synthetase
MLDRDDLDALFPRDLPGPDHWERRYPPRHLPSGAQVTRFCPSPTGSLHLGGIYVATLDLAVARQSGGTYLIRIEDTDQEREVAGAVAEFDRALAWFGLNSDEPEEVGRYGPYVQSQRSTIYMTYARELLRAGKAYPCFCTREELAALADEQRAAKVTTGYYGRWAPWRDAADDLVRERLAAGAPYVVRFRSPGEGDRRASYTDVIRGEVSADDNRNDIVILKSSGNVPRLPTYHFAHVVDDHLMRVTLVIRGEEWMSSVPVHLQLFDAAGFDRIPYAHVAPLLKQDGASRRKLSKRKDPEASVEFYIAAGYPRDAILGYLRGLANSRLADRPIPETLREPVRLEECGTGGPVVDLAKLEDIAANFIATISSEDVLDAVLQWARTYDRELATAVASQRDMALRALDIERVGVDNPRKDLHKWSDFRGAYGYFFDAVFGPPTDPADERFGGIDPEAVTQLCSAVLDGYEGDDTSDAWFDQIRVAAAATRFAPTARAFKEAPSAYVGSIREASHVIRVLLTGSGRSLPLNLVARVLGEDEVRRRIGAVLDRVAIGRDARPRV